jgi:hypothetical protein
LLASPKTANNHGEGKRLSFELKPGGSLTMQKLHSCFELEEEISETDKKVKIRKEKKNSFSSFHPKKEVNKSAFNFSLGFARENLGDSR